MASRLALLANHIAFGWGLRRVHFGVFEADLHAAELFENGCSGDALGPVAQMGIVPERVKARTVVQFIRLAKTGCIHWISMALTGLTGECSLTGIAARKSWPSSIYLPNTWTVRKRCVNSKDGFTNLKNS